MTVPSRGLCFLAGLVMASAACAKDPKPGAARDAGFGKDVGVVDTWPSANDSMGAVSPSAGKDAGSPDVEDHWTIPHSGGPVWRNSTVPYCGFEDGWFGRIGDLWSDSRGVYLIRTVSNNSGLYFNAGSGWSRVSPQPRVELNSITGIPSGPLLLYADSNCGLTAFDGKTESCLVAVPDVSSVFALDAQRVFAIAKDRLLILNGAYFVQYGVLSTSSSLSYQLWADSQVVVVADRAGNLFLYDDASVTPEVLTTPDGMAVMSLWGFGRNDLWVGDDKGRLAHYDGDSWATQQVALGNCQNVSQLWGAEHVLYFATDNHVGRWSDGKVDTVLEGPCVQDPKPTAGGTYEQVTIQKIWGNSTTEVFIAVQEFKETMTPVGDYGATFSDVGPDACGQFRLYWFDGERLGRL